MHVRDVLSRKGSAVATVPSGAGVQRALDMLVEHNIGALVVREPDNADSRIEGIVSERDLVRNLQNRGAEVLLLSVAEVMTSQVVTCSPDDDVEQAMRVMTERHVRHLPVVDRSGSMVGLVSIGDIVKNRIDDLETTAEQLVTYISSGN